MNEVTIQKKVTVGFDRVMESLPNRKVLTKVDTQVQCGKENSKDHYKVNRGIFILEFHVDVVLQEWEMEEKLKPEIRTNIRRDFLAMIRKEKELGSQQKSNKSVIYNTVDQPAQSKIRNKNKLDIKENIESANIKVQDEEEENQKNFHSSDCKTCQRMISIMGTILPHPVNA